MRRSSATVFSCVVLANGLWLSFSAPAIADSSDGLAGRHPSTASSSPLICDEAAEFLFFDDFESMPWCDPCRWSASVGAGDPDCTPQLSSASIVQSGFEAYCSVLFSDHVVTALAVDDRSLWVSESPAAGGELGEYHGIFVLRGVSTPPLPTGLQIGDLVLLTGAPFEFDPCPGGDSVTALFADSIDRVGFSGFPAPFWGVSVGILASMEAGEPFEGVLVAISGVEVTASGASDQLTLTDGSAASIRIDDYAYDYSAATYPIGTCFSSVTGVMSVDLVNDYRVILPRSESDLEIGPCP